VRPLAVAAVLLTAGCASTTYDASLASTSPTRSTTTTLPSGPACAVLPRMLSTAHSMSAVISDKGDDEGVLAAVSADWKVVSAEVEAKRPELLDDFDDVLRMLGTASRFNRPADADKATKNLTTLVAAFGSC